MKDQIKFYKIKDITTGLYSCGGLQPVFNKRGKTWNNIGHVKSHLIGIKQHVETQKKATYHRTPIKEYQFKNWEIQEFVFEQKDCKVIPIEELIISAGMF